MKALPLFALGVLVSSCATFDPKKGHDVVATQVRERIGAETGWGEGSPAAEQVAKRVDELLARGITQHTAVQLALVNNPNLQATYEELGVSQADLIQAGLLTNPSLDVAIGFPVLTPAIDELQVGIVQEFVSLFSLPLRKRVAQEQFFADTMRVTHEALRVAAEAKREVIALQALEQQLALQRSVSSAGKAEGELARRQHTAGNINDLELAERSVVVEQARMEQAQTELSVVAQRERLNRLLGLWGKRTGWALAEKALPELPKDEVSSEHLESLAIRQRFDLAAARTQVELMRNSVHLARTWRYFGRVEVGVDTHQDPNGPRLVGPSFSLDLPIFDQRQGVIARLESQHRQSERKLTALSVEARSEVRENWARLMVQRQLVTHLKQKVLPLRARVNEHAQLQYNAMQIGLYRLLEVKREELETSKRYLDALREYWTAAVELERVVGGRLPRAQPSKDPRP